MGSTNNLAKRKTIGDYMGVVISYTVFVVWTLITIIPLFWLLYSSFKTNDELTRNIYSLPDALFTSYKDEYIVIRPSLNLPWDHDPAVDKRERLIIESATIAPDKGFMVFFLHKDKLPPEIADLTVGDRVKVSQLPFAIQMKVNWSAIWYNFSSSFTRGKLGIKFVNSVIYVVVSTFLVVLFGLMIGFAISKLQFRKLSSVISVLFVLGYLISISSIFIPLFLALKSINLVDTHLGIILAYTAFGLPVSVMLSSQFMRGLPDSLIESAYIDGASTFRTFLEIIFPMSMPVVVTIAIFNALWIWNEFLLVMILASKDVTQSLPVGVNSFSSIQVSQYGWQLAALVIALLPAMLVYFAFNKRIAEGVVTGAVKG